MRIYRMTATFGKLEHAVLTLEPGLNVIEAPNEWGKTTWCAFLVTMLYGLDTRTKTTKTALADKEKYMPWSGSPMEGRIDLNWNGRDITIERSTKGRTPMGVFRAYETASGLAVPELTASNCGLLLLGVEQGVYRRTGFIRQADMPVTQDEALRRRLNALVTTGDETGDSDRLATQLKDLKNKCRYNRSGLLPQAEQQRRELEEQLAELDSLQQHSCTLKERIGEAKSWLRTLENHWDALRYAAAQEDAGRVATIRDLRDQAEAKVAELERICTRQPSRQEVERKLSAIQSYREELDRYRLEEQVAAPCPEQPVPPEIFRGLTMEQARKMVEQDVECHGRLMGSRPYGLFFWMGIVLLILGVVAALLGKHVLTAISATLGFSSLLFGQGRKNACRREAQDLQKKYGSAFPEAWVLQLQHYQKEQEAYEQALMNYRVARGDLDIRNTFLQKQRESLFGDQTPERVLEIWQQMQQQWDDYEKARRELCQAENYLQTLQCVVQTDVKCPSMEDELTYSAEETQEQIAQARTQEQRLQNRLGQYQGRMEMLGNRDALQNQLRAVEQRIERLEDIYSAVVIALETLSQAQQDLQRRFAPRISSRAQELLCRMTGSRYDRLTFNQDLSLLAGAEQENVLRGVQWRSDGTADQLYLALRLAVAEELIPDVPLVLDDALVRFDDIRLGAAMDILKEASAQKQVILFTCHARERKICNS